MIGRAVRLLASIPARAADRNGPATAALQIVLLIGAAAGAIWLSEVDPPWSESIRERLARRGDDGWRVKDYADVYWWWAAAVNVALLVVTVALSPLWARRIDRWWSGFERRRFIGRGTVWFAIGVAGAVAVGAWYRAPRLDDSLWNDEEYALRRYVWGEYDVQPDGSLEFEPVGWEEALAGSPNGNNHLWHTIEARVALGIWRGIREPGRPDFSETALRAVPFVSGLATIAALAVLGAAAGSGLCGVAAAWIAALSPWHIRYSVEARGYSSMLLFITIALICLIRGIETSKWRWWLGYAVCEAVYLLCFAGSLYVALATNLAAGGFLIWRWLRGTGTIQEVGRLAVANVLAAVAVIQLMLPTVPQILDYLAAEDHQSEIAMDGAWLRDAWVHVVAGVPWSVPEASLGLGKGVQEIRDGGFAGFGWVILFGVPLFAAVGAAAMWLSGWQSRIVVFALWGAAAVSLAHNWLSNSKMYSWYLLYVVLALALALGWIVRLVSRHSSSAPAVGVAALIVAGMAALTAEPRRLLVAHERQPMAALVESIRGEAHAHGPSDGGILTGSFGVSDRQIASYDPRARIVRTPEEILALVEEAEAAGKEAVVYFAGRRGTAERYPEAFELVTESGSFERLGAFRGIEGMFSYEAFRWREE